MMDNIFDMGVTLENYLLCLGAGVLLGLVTALVFTWRSDSSASLRMTLVLLPMAVASVIFLVNGNIGTGVAVAGAFALVRFRSAQGTGREIAAIFIDMAIGLALGVGYLYLAVILCLFACAVVLVMTLTGFSTGKNREKQLRITIPESFDYAGLFDDIFKTYRLRVRLERIRTTNMGTMFELTYRASFPKGEVHKAMIDEIRARNGNLTVSVCDITDRESL